MNFDTLLEKIETSRPDLSESFSLIRQFQKEKNGGNNNIEYAEIETSKVQQLEMLLEKQHTINKSLLQHYNQLEKNYQLLIKQLDEVAEAMGACPHCWGEDSTCNYCRGRGVPGYFQPSQGYFDTYIKPVIFKLKNGKPNL